jgi:hypothetical protein
MPYPKRGMVAVCVLDDRGDRTTRNGERYDGPNDIRLRLDQAEYFFVCLDWFASELKVSISADNYTESNAHRGNVVASLSPPQARRVLKRLSKKLRRKGGARLARAYGYPASAEDKIDQARSFIVAALELIAVAKEGERGLIVYWP